MTRTPFALVLSIAAVALAGCATPAPVDGAGDSPSASPPPAEAPVWDGTGCPEGVLDTVTGGAVVDASVILPSAVADIVAGGCVVTIPDPDNAQTLVFAVQPDTGGLGEAVSAAVEAEGWFAAGPGYAAPDDHTAIEFGSSSSGGVVGTDWPELGEAFAEFDGAVFVLKEYQY